MGVCLFQGPAESWLRGAKKTGAACLGSGLGGSIHCSKTRMSLLAWNSASQDMSHCNVDQLITVQGQNAHRVGALHWSLEGT